MSARPRGPILVVEADRNLGRAIADQLAADGYAVELAHSAEHARILARGRAPTLALLGDLESPSGALRLLEEIRESDPADASWDRSLPTIVVGSRAQQLDMLRAFEVGADDFLASPPGYLELRARMRAILRRAEGAPELGRLLEVGSLLIDTSARAASLNGRALVLRRLEFELLAHLARDPERVFSREELLRTIWGYRSSGSTRTVDSHASRLRRKLDADGAERWVINVWGIGYRLT